MKTSNLVATALVAFAAAGSAFAQEAVYEQPKPMPSATTRAAVMADLQQARASGTLQLTEQDRQSWGSFVATRSRADVQAETRAAAASGEIQALNSEAGLADQATMAKAAVPRLLAALQ